MKIQEVIQKIRDYHEPFVEGKVSRDQVLTGDVNQECTGVCVTICATYDVIQEAIKRNANLIITHESIFYGSRVDVSVLENSEVYKTKLKLINDNNIVIYRDHDRIHGNGQPLNPIRYNPELIFYGISKELGWDDYIMDDKLKPCWYKIPSVKAGDLASMLIKRFSLRGLRIVGDLDFEVSTVWFAGHIDGSAKDSKILAEADKADVILPFEIVDYTLSEYANDACQMGKPKVIMEMGHFNCEELGMKYMEKWLKQLVPNLKVSFIQSEDLFKYLVH